VPGISRHPTRDSLFLFHQFNFAGTPSLVDPRFERGIHAKDHEPALAGNRLDPVVLVTLWRLGAVVDGVGSVLILLEPLGISANSGRGLFGLEHGPRLGVVDRDDPEVADRRTSRKSIRSSSKSSFYHS
jgi:hypothetical protein